MALFRMGLLSEPLCSDIEPFMQQHSAKFFQNLEQADISSVVADTVRQAYTGRGAHSRTLDNPMNVASRSLSDTAGPSQLAHTEYRDFFDRILLSFRCHFFQHHGRWLLRCPSLGLMSR